MPHFKFVMCVLPRVHNIREAPIVACYITAYCLHRYTPSVYRNILFHTINTNNNNHKRGRIDRVI